MASGSPCLQYEDIIRMRYFWLEVFSLINPYNLKYFNSVCKGFRDILNIKSLSLTTSQSSVLNKLLMSKSKVVKLCAPMSYGKTILSIYFAKAHKGQGIFVIRTNTIAQWEEEIQKWGEDEDEFLFCLSSYNKKGYNYIKECINKKEKPKEKFLIFTVGQTNTVNKIIPLLESPILILDEFHKGKEELFQEFAANQKIERVLGITASSNLSKKGEGELFTVPLSEVDEYIPVWKWEMHTLDSECLEASLSYVRDLVPPAKEGVMEKIIENFQLEGKTVIFYCVHKAILQLESLLIFRTYKDVENFKNKDYKYLLFSFTSNVEGLNMPYVKNVIIIFPENVSYERTQQLLGRTIRTTSDEKSIRTISICLNEPYNIAATYVHLANRSTNDRFKTDFKKKYYFHFTPDKWEFFLKYELDEYQTYVLFSALYKIWRNTYKLLFGRSMKEFYFKPSTRRIE